MTTETELYATNTEYEDTNFSQEEDIAEPQVKTSEEKQAEIVRAKQADLDSGRVKIEDLPEWIQKKVTAPKPSEDLEEKITKRVKESLEFDSIKNAAYEVATKEQREEMETILNDPELKSIPQLKRVQYAMAQTGITKAQMEAEILRKGISIGRGRMMPAGNYEHEEKSKIDKDSQAYIDSLPARYRKK